MVFNSSGLYYICIIFFISLLIVYLSKNDIVIPIVDFVNKLRDRRVYEHNYKLGDLIRFKYYRNNTKVQEFYKKWYPNSIAVDYINLTNDSNRIDIINFIITNRYLILYLIIYLILYLIIYLILYLIIYLITNRTNLNNKPANNMVIVHLRLGDVIENNRVNMKGLTLNDIYEHQTNNHYVHPCSYYEKVIKIIKRFKKNITNVVIVGGFHKSLIPTNSYAYTEKISDIFELNGFNVIKRIGNNDADEDFIFMCNANYFVPGGGGFSSLISSVVLFKNKRLFYPIADNVEAYYGYTSKNNSKIPKKKYVN
jgi:hypothetical protein